MDSIFLRNEKIYDVIRDVWLELSMNPLMVHRFWFWLGVNSNVFGCKILWILWFYEHYDEFSCYLIIDISDLKVIIFEVEVVLCT